MRGFQGIEVRGSLHRRKEVHQPLPLIHSDGAEREDGFVERDSGILKVLQSAGENVSGQDDMNAGRPESEERGEKFERIFRIEHRIFASVGWKRQRRIPPGGSSREKTFEGKHASVGKNADGPIRRLKGKNAGDAGFGGYGAAGKRVGCIRYCASGIPERSESGE